MKHFVIRTGFSPTLPPRRACRGPTPRRMRSAGKKTVCCACSIECQPDGELRLDMIFDDGQTRSHRVTGDTAPKPGDLSQISALISRWIRWRP